MIQGLDNELNGKDRLRERMHISRYTLHEGHVSPA